MVLSRLNLNEPEWVGWKFRIARFVPMVVAYLATMELYSDFPFAVQFGFGLLAAVVVGGFLTLLADRYVVSDPEASARVD